MGLLKEKILKKYPKGTKFYDLVGNRLFVSSGELPSYFEPSSNEMYILVEPSEYSNKSARIFKDGKFAKIFNSLKFELWTY